jgi:hypothetical protein
METNRGAAMNTLRMLTAGMLWAAAAATAMAAEEPSLDTVPVTAKRHGTVPAAAEAPREAVQIPLVLLSDMPEAEIDFHLTPVTPPPVPAVARATL